MMSMMCVQSHNVVLCKERKGTKGRKPEKIQRNYFALFRPFTLFYLFAGGAAGAGGAGVGVASVFSNDFRFISNLCRVSTFKL